MSIANVRAITHHLEKQMFEAQRKCDWLNFYRHLLLRDLISQVIVFYWPIYFLNKRLRYSNAVVVIIDYAQKDFNGYSMIILPED